MSRHHRCLLVALVAVLSGCDVPQRARQFDEELVRICAMQLGRNAYENQVGQVDEEEWPLPPFPVALYGAGRIATGYSPQDRLSFMRMYAGSRYEPHWRGPDFMLTDEAKQRIEVQRLQSYRAGGRRYLQLVRQAIPLCEKDPTIIAPQNPIRPDEA